MGDKLAPSVVLDTNVLVSAIYRTGSNPCRIMELALGRKVKLYYSSEMMTEYKSVLYRSKYNFSHEVLARLFDGIAENGHLTAPVPSTFAMPDENDRIFYDTAKASGSYLIAGNTKHYPTEPFVVTPAEFIDLIAPTI